jgi:hypothetical protein
MNQLHVWSLVYILAISAASSTGFPFLFMAGR